MSCIHCSSGILLEYAPFQDPLEHIRPVAGLGHPRPAINCTRQNAIFLCLNSNWAQLPEQTKVFSIYFSNIVVKYQLLWYHGIITVNHSINRSSQYKYIRLYENTEGRSIIYKMSCYIIDAVMIWALRYSLDPEIWRDTSQITKFMGPTWGPTGSCRPQMGPMLAPWTLLSGLAPLLSTLPSNFKMFEPQTISNQWPRDVPRSDNEMDWCLMN